MAKASAKKQPAPAPRKAHVGSKATSKSSPAAASALKKPSSKTPKIAQKKVSGKNVKSTPALGKKADRPQQAAIKTSSSAKKAAKSASAQKPIIAAPATGKQSDKARLSGKGGQTPVAQTSVETPPAAKTALLKSVPLKSPPAKGASPSSVVAKNASAKGSPEQAVEAKDTGSKASPTVNGKAVIKAATADARTEQTAKAKVAAPNVVLNGKPARGKKGAKPPLPVHPFIPGKPGPREGSRNLGPDAKLSLGPEPKMVPRVMPVPEAVPTDGKPRKNQAGLGLRDLENFRDLLLAKRRELVGDMSQMEREALRSSGNSNLSTLPIHMADMGTDNYEQEFTLGLVEKDRNLLRDINSALAKIQNGTFGICEGSGEPIGRPRLEAQPWSRFSIEWARRLEGRGRRI